MAQAHPGPGQQGQQGLQGLQGPPGIRGLVNDRDDKRP